MYSQQVKEDARRAAAYIRKHGWCQGSIEDDDGSVCAIGACQKIDPSFEYHSDEGLDQAIRDVTGVYGYALFWNDAPGRTKEEVLEVFDRIANS